MLWTALHQDIFPRVTYFPKINFNLRETESATMTSLPEGSFNFDERDKTGEWTINMLASQPSSSAPQDNHVKLSGRFKLKNCSMSEINAGLIAVVNARIKDYSFSGSKIDKITCSLTGNTSKDDASIYRGYKNTAFVKNLEYRLWRMNF